MIPVDGPIRIINSHPTPEAVSDALGGAMAAPLIFGVRNNRAMWVRETCVSEGLDRNTLASVLAVVFAGTGQIIPVVGPAVFTRLVWVDDPHGMQTGMPEGFPAEVSAPMFTVTEDIRHALAGFDDGFSSPPLSGEWSAMVRATAERCRMEPLPDGYPEMGTAGLETDPVWQGLARARGVTGYAEVRRLGS
jgi:hypothetical protein